jgi:hypothetical protein
MSFPLITKSVPGFQGMTVINLAVFENELFSYWKSGTGTSARRMCAHGREYLRQRTERC